MEFQEKFTIVFFIVNLYNEINKFQFGTIINGIKTLAKGMLSNYLREHTFLTFIKSICGDNLEFWRIDIREIYIQLGIISRLFPILVASIILQKFIVNSITIVKGVDTNENQSLLQIFTFCYENKGKLHV